MAKTFLVDDLREASDLYHAQAAPSGQLSAVAIQYRHVPVAKAHIDALTLLSRAIREMLLEFEPYALLGDSIWLPDTKLNRYTKLRRQEKNTPFFSQGEWCREYVVQSDKGIKAFTAFRCGTVDARLVGEVLRGRPANHLGYVRITNAQDTIEILTMTGWEPRQTDMLFSHEFSAAMLDGNMVIHSPLGAYDDADAGACLVGSPDLIRRCEAALNRFS